MNLTDPDTRRRLWRPAGTTAQVEDLRTKWQRLVDLDCGHDYECPEFTERHQAVDDAADQVSWWQERKVARGLDSHRPPGISARLRQRGQA